MDSVEGPAIGIVTAQTNVFTRRDGTIRHFWSGEMTGHHRRPSQAPAAPPTRPRSGWCWIDPDGRGTDWYPKLDYAA